MEIRQLKTFQAVARLLSFNRAAQVLHYAQSTVSAQIRLLEEELGVQLFDRLGKSIVLTEAGAQLVEYTRQLLAIEAETRTRVSGLKEPVGKIALRIPQSLGIHVFPHIIREFNQRYKKIGFDINACSFRVLKDEFRNGITDVAFLIQDSISSGDLKAEVLGYTRILAVCAADHAAAGKKKFELNDFNNQTLIIPLHDCSYRMEFEKALTDNNIVPNAKIKVNSLEIVKKMV
ncbi:MAG: LysR family transcriptional regulator, partial [Desulfobacteraceae bacterium]|nr:LysR family transcriptional regulator [Desulfobacteraceae bacterium]